MEFDFSSAKQRIEEALARLEDRHDDASIEATLRARAEDLANRKPRRTPARATGQDTIVAMRRAELLIGIRAQRIERVHWSYACVLGNGPPAVVGLLMEASEPIALVDVARPVKRVGHGVKVLAAVCTTAAGPLALLVDEIIGPRPLAKLASAAELSFGPMVEGRDEDGLLLIDLDALAEWSDLRVE
jgi:hypothetical protein